MREKLTILWMVPFYSLKNQKNTVVHALSILHEVYCLLELHVKLVHGSYESSTCCNTRTQPNHPFDNMYNLEKPC